MAHFTHGISLRYLFMYEVIEQALWALLQLGTPGTLHEDSHIRNELKAPNYF